VAIGGSLAETIALNSVRYVDDDPTPRTADDAPAWEREERIPAKEKTLVSGYVDFLTLTTRRVLLKRDPDGLVRRCRYAQGLAPREIGARDPFVPYRETKTGLAPMRPSPGRELWRDLPAIAAGLADRRQSTGVLRWAAQLTDGAAVRLRTVGIVRSQAKIDTVVDGELRIPPVIALSLEHRGALQDAVKLADDSEKALSRALRTAAEHAGAGAEARQVARRLLAATPYWARLERPYDTLIDALSTVEADALEEQSEPERQWRGQLRRESRRSYEEAVRLLGSSPRELIAGARGRNQLARGLDPTTPRTCECGRRGDMTDAVTAQPDRFLPGLYALLDQRNRGRLAALRRGLGRPVATPGDAAREFYRLLPAEASNRAEMAYWTAATLFAAFPPRHGANVAAGLSVGAALRRLGEQQGGDDALARVERRVLQLLAARLPRAEGAVMGVLPQHRVVAARLPGQQP
jgi:CRISPR type I-E-associated protein CasB/Cse2